MVADAGFPQEQRRQLFQRGGVEALIVPVRPVVAQTDAEAVDLLRRQGRLCIMIDFFELPVVRHAGVHQTGFLAELDNGPPLLSFSREIHFIPVL